MHLIVCIEDRDGMSFCGRRLSSDRAVTERIWRLASGSKLWMNRYSSGLFSDKAITVDEDFLQKAENEDYCFLENTPVPENLKSIESIVIFHWNRRYPSTVRFPRSILAGRELVETVEFTGHSHDRITMERYR